MTPKLRVSPTGGLLSSGVSRRKEVGREKKEKRGEKGLQENYACTFFREQCNECDILPEWGQGAAIMQQRLGTQIEFEILELRRQIDSQQDKVYVLAHVGWVKQLKLQRDLDDIAGSKGRCIEAPRTILPSWSGAEGI